MLQMEREAKDCFAFLASPMASGGYGLMIYPMLPEADLQLEVSKKQMRVFLLRHGQNVAVEQISGTEDLFVSALTADEIRELIGVTAATQPYLLTV